MSGVSTHGHTRWRVSREFHCADWPDGSVIYDLASGDTHQLSPAAAHILNLIQATPHSLHTLAASDSSPPDPDALSAVEAIVVALTDLGLIEPEQP